MKNSENDHLEIIKRLNQENKRLFEENKKYKRILDSQNKQFSWLTGMAFYFIAGPNLIDSIKNFFVNLIENKKVTIDDSANLVAALIKRFTRIGIIGLVLTIVPIILLLWQNIEIKNQNQLIYEQLTNEQQNNLSKTLFGEVRQKQEAIVKYLKLLKPPNGIYQLAGINLSAVIIPKNINFKNADLRRANLIDSIFANNDLSFADLSHSSLIKADLSEVNLSYANLSNADLVGANLRSTNLEGARLNNTNLSGADLSFANLENAIFDEACHNSKDCENTDEKEGCTRWPKNFDIKKAKLKYCE